MARHRGAEVVRRVVPDRVAAAFPQQLAAVISEVTLEVSTPQATATSIVTRST